MLIHQLFEMASGPDWLAMTPADLARILTDDNGNPLSAKEVAVAQARLRARVDDTGHLEIWRAMRLRSVRHLEAGDGIGRYWADSPTMAIPYDAGRGGMLYRFHARISAEHVDWPGTIGAHVAKESEIRAKDHAPITLLSIEMLSENGSGHLVQERPDLVGATMTTGPAV